ncbi:MAG: hypothetical protein ACF8R7_01020 [Phycisphaerales bacterium JB039]
MDINAEFEPQESREPTREELDAEVRRLRRRVRELESRWGETIDRFIRAAIGLVLAIGVGSLLFMALTEVTGWLSQAIGNGTLALMILVLGPFFALLLIAHLYYWIRPRRG